MHAPKHNAIAILAITAAITLDAQQLLPATYKIKDLGPLPTSNISEALGINSHRVTVGTSLQGTNKAVIWRPNAYPFDLSVPVGGAAYANGINDAGIIVGYTDGPSGPQAFGWDPVSGGSILPVYSPPGTNYTHVFAYQINSSKQVVGEQFIGTAGGPLGFAVVWQYGAGTIPMVLPNPFPQKIVGAAAINDLGLVGGQLNAVAALWDLQNGAAYKLLGKFPNDFTAKVLGLDKHSHFAVGASADKFNSHAFFAVLQGWNAPVTLIPIGDPTATGYHVANAVNSSGQVVGSMAPQLIDYSAFLWDQAHGLRDLNTLVAPGSGWHLATASSINDHGEIVGQGFITHANGTLSAHGYMLVQDDIAPSVNCQQPNGQWHGSNVSFNCSANDAIAGLADPADLSFALTTGIPAGAETATASTGARQICDSVGNCTNAGPLTGVKIDRKPPVIRCAVANRLWHAANVTIACDAQDGGSGVANPGILLKTAVPAGVETANAAVGPASACDRVGNCAFGPVVGGNKIDRKPPSINIVLPQPGVNYLIGSAIPANYSCTDGGSGVAACDGTVAAGVSIDTQSTGPRQLVVKATDQVGNASQKTVDYNVTYKVCFDPGQLFAVGTLAKVRMSLCDFKGVTIQGANVTLAATGLSPSGTLPLQRRFRSVGQGVYEYDIDTTGFATGGYALEFKVSGDPVVHSVPFRLWVPPAGQ